MKLLSVAIPCYNLKKHKLWDYMENHDKDLSMDLVK